MVNLFRTDSKQILAWADAHHQRFGQWPMKDSGPIPEADGETWLAVDAALYQGQRGQPGGSSLARLLARKRGVRNHMNLPPLTIEQVLWWADAYHKRTGQWPKVKSGPIPEAPDLTWNAIDTALAKGARGLPGGTTLTRLLAEQRGKRNQCCLPPLTPEVILGWAESYYERTGRWPSENAGPIPEAPGENWRAIASALRQGLRGLPGGSSLFRLLREHGSSKEPRTPSIKSTR